jgi:hypothetical protein
LLNFIWNTIWNLKAQLKTKLAKFYMKYKMKSDVQNSNRSVYIVVYIRISNCQWRLYAMTILNMRDFRESISTTVIGMLLEGTIVKWLSNLLRASSNLNCVITWIYSYHEQGVCWRKNTPLWKCSIISYGEGENL